MHRKLQQSKFLLPTGVPAVYKRHSQPSHAWSLTKLQASSLHVVQIHHVFQLQAVPRSFTWQDLTSLSELTMGHLGIGKIKEVKFLHWAAELCFLPPARSPLWVLFPIVACAVVSLHETDLYPGVKQMQ